MKSKKVKLEKLAKKGINISLSIPDAKSWKERTKKDRRIPRSFSQTRRLIHHIFGAKGKRSKKTIRPEVFDRTQISKPLKGVPLRSIRKGYYIRRFEECHEELYARLFSALSNPYLTPKQLNILESDLEDATPVFENSLETEHFILKWTNSSSHSADNISETSIIEETGEYLETAWDQYETTFRRAPYLPEDASKMEIIFQDIGAIGIASPPDGPIQFDSESWISNPGVRQPTSAHELFHKLQYAFGYRTKHTPSGNYKWFSEGTASWSEVFIWKRVSGAYKILDLFSNPDLNLYSASYRALPYWIFFEARQKDSVNDNAISDFLYKYEALDSSTSFPERVAYAEVIDEDWPENNVFGQTDTFFALFSRDRRLGHWRLGPEGNLYPSILGPDDNPIEPVLTVIEADLGSGDAYNNNGFVSNYGSDYYLLKFENDAEGEDINISVDGSPTGDFSYFLIWEKNGAWKRASFPFHMNQDYGGTYTLNLSNEDSLILVISGRGTGGAYSITASIT